jgi:predicted Zn-dependent protease
LGSALAKQGKLQEAKEHLQKSIELGNGEPEVHYELARVLLGLGDSAKSHDEMSIFQKLKNSQSEKTQAAGKAE